jgi:thioesterase domain-containing protein
MRRVQPQGPYRVVGHSFGGVVAYEIARQLLREQQAVEFVGLIDCYRPTAQLSAMLEAEVNITEVQLLAILINFLFPYIEPALLAELESIAGVEAAVERAQQENLLPPEMSAEHVRRWARNWRASHAAMAKYTPPALELDVHQFAAEDTLPGEDDSRGWRALLGSRVHCIPVGGSHYTIIMQPTVKLLARHISAAIERAAHAAATAASRVCQDTPETS